MKTQYRKVLCSDRLPEKDGWYFTQHGTSRYYVESGFYINANWWLEEINQSVPTVEEIVEILIETLNLDGNRGGHSYWIDLESEKEAARAIHKLYGGELTDKAPL